MNHPALAPDDVAFPSSARAVAAFYLLTFLFSWSVWGSVIADDNGVASFHLPEALTLWSLLPATLLVAVFTGGLPALKDLGARLVRWRVAPAWYTVSLLLPLALAFLPAVGYSLAGGSVPTGVDMPLGPALGYFAFGIVLFALTEETAWRGFALPRLLARFSPLVSAVAVGVLWAVWHIPLWFVSDAPQRDWPYPGFFLLTVAESADHVDVRQRPRKRPAGRRLPRVERRDSRLQRGAVRGSLAVLAHRRCVRRGGSRGRRALRDGARARESREW